LDNDLAQFLSSESNQDQCHPIIIKIIIISIDFALEQTYYARENPSCHNHFEQSEQSV